MTWEPGSYDGAILFNIHSHGFRPPQRRQSAHGTPAPPLYVACLLVLRMAVHRSQARDT